MNNIIPSNDYAYKSSQSEMMLNGKQCTKQY